MKLVFYCIMNNFKGVGLNLRSMDDQKILFIHSNDLYAAVSHTHYKAFEETQTVLSRYEGIIRTIRRCTPAAPFPFNTIIGEIIGRGALCTYYEDLIRILDETGNKEECIITVYRSIQKKIKAIVKQSSKYETFGKKTDRSKYNKIYDIAGHKLAGKIHNYFAQLAVRSNYERLISNELLLQGYYLVNPEAIDSFRDIFKWVQKLYPELQLNLQGPQLPYHFNTVDIMIKNTPLYGRRLEI